MTRGFNPALPVYIAALNPAGPEPIIRTLQSMICFSLILSSHNKFSAALVNDDTK
jgi:hypothetical protein